MSAGVKNLTEGGIFSQLTKLALPIMATSFVQMAYSLTDMAWVGRLGSPEVAAVGAVGILIWLTSSFALLSKVGAEVSIGHSIGAGKMEEARIYASHATTISFIMGLTVASILFFLDELIISFFRLEPSISAMACDYLRIVSTSLPLVFMVLTFSGIYNGSGRSLIPFYLTATGLICNILLDPLFIFVFHLGTNGAAIATWISQVFVFVLFVWQMKRPNGILNGFPYIIKPQKKFTVNILKLGAPVALMNVLFASINLYLARIASVFGGYIGVMSQTTGGQIEGITWNTSLGFSTALGAFVAQNYAAGKFDRMKKAYYYTLSLMLSFGVVVTFAFLFFGKEIFGIFVPEEIAMKAGGEYLYIMGFSQIFMMLELTTQGMFNGTGRTVPPAVVSIVFNAARIPLALLLAPNIGVTGVWMAITISAIFKGVLLPVWFSVVYKRIKNNR
ncbi:MAG: MATE family efflux transporter [Dysgonamonadaceae bacterium]|nr:MATE family efflux transporter [Dysgonamonadaceae bacterium]